MKKIYKTCLLCKFSLDLTWETLELPYGELDEALIEVHADLEIICSLTFLIYKKKYIPFLLAYQYKDGIILEAANLSKELSGISHLILNEVLAMHLSFEDLDLQEVRNLAFLCAPAEHSI